MQARTAVETPLDEDGDEAEAEEEAGEGVLLEEATENVQMLV